MYRKGMGWLSRYLISSYSEEIIPLGRERLLTSWTSQFIYWQQKFNLTTMLLLYTIRLYSYTVRVQLACYTGRNIATCTIIIKFFQVYYHTSSIEDNLYIVCLLLGGEPYRKEGGYGINSSSPMAASTSVSKSRTPPPQTLLECTWPGFNNGIVKGHSSLY